MLQDNDKKVNPDAKTLRVQLVELNNRARWYSSQLWQLPFAFLGITGLSLATFIDKKPLFLALALFVCSIFGLCICIHIMGILDGEKRAVNDLQDIEYLLKLPKTAKLKKYTKPLCVIVFLLTIFYFIFSFVVLISIFCKK